MILSRLDKFTALNQFVQDAFIDGAVTLVHLEPGDTRAIADTMKQFRLDFDDAYQYVAAQKYGLVLVSFDSDFDRTPRGRTLPKEAS